MKLERCIVTCALLLVGILCSYASAKSSKGHQFLWQTNSYGDDVHVIDVDTHKVVGHIKVGPQPHGIAAPDDAPLLALKFKNPMKNILSNIPKTSSLIQN